MRVYMRSSGWLMFACFLLLPLPGLCQELSVSGVIEKIEKTIGEINDFSCTFVFTQFKADEKEDGKNYEHVWEVKIKKPYLMAIHTPEGDLVTSGEGKRSTAFYLDKKNKTFTKTILNRFSWPAFPSLEAELINLKNNVSKSKDQASVATREGKWILSVPGPVGNLENVYVVDSLTNLFVSAEIYRDHQRISSFEWRDIKINSGLKDEDFKLNPPEDYHVITRESKKSEK